MKKKEKLFERKSKYNSKVTTRIFNLIAPTMVIQSPIPHDERFLLSETSQVCDKHFTVLSWKPRELKDCHPSRVGNYLPARHGVCCILSIDRHFWM